MKRLYDTIVILDISLDDAAIDHKIQKIEEIIKGNGGEILKQEKWGKRKLTYEIKKKPEGFFIYFNHSGEPVVLEQLQNMFRFDEMILKTMTIVVETVKKSRYARKKEKKKDKPAVPAAAAVAAEVEGEEVIEEGK